MPLATPLQRCSTGIPGFDDILAGGFPRNRLYLIEGDPGVGKTTIALQFLREGQRVGEQGLYITLSETAEELASVADSHQWDMEGIAVLDLSSIENQLGLVQQNTFFHPSELELQKTSEILTTQIEKVKPTRVVLDSLSEMRLLAENPLRYRRQMLALKQFFVGKNATVLLLDDRTSNHSDLHIRSIAHGVIVLEKLPVSFGVPRRRLEVAKLRGSQFREGSHDYLILRGGVKVFPRLTASEHRARFTPEKVSSNVPALDALLGGGLDRGTSTLLIGPAGTGKSTIALQHGIAAARRGEHVVVFCFDENLNTLHMRAASMNMPLPELEAAGLIAVQQVDPAELSPGEFTHRVREAMDKHAARMIILDSLNGYLNAMPDERFLTLQLHELLSFLGQSGIVTLMTLAQHGLVGQMQTPVDLTYLADTVIMLRYFEADGLLRKAISVVKKRGSHHEDQIREFKLTTSGLRVGEPLQEFRGILTGTPLVYEGKGGMLSDQ